MEQWISEKELFRSCEILFGTDLDISREFLDYLQTGTKMVESDNRGSDASVRQQPPAAPSRQHFFHAKKIKPITLPTELHRTAVTANTEDLYRGPLPRRPLLFGHFLYYSGLTNWRTIARILTWQRAERPRLGELGRRFGMCRQEDVDTILLEKNLIGQPELQELLDRFEHHNAILQAV